ncbi:MAG: hypothetical protein GY708_05030, partial [Actinomycetia bacterium]|nr:hypothetical protein [Actinomycetes bacterium]
MAALNLGVGGGRVVCGAGVVVRDGGNVDDVGSVVEYVVYVYGELDGPRFTGVAVAQVPVD